MNSLSGEMAVVFRVKNRSSSYQRALLLSFTDSLKVGRAVFKSLRVNIKEHHFGSISRKLTECPGASILIPFWVEAEYAGISL